MKEYEQILQLTKDDTVELGASFKELLNKELCLGMTRYVCRNGTLSDGFEKITPAQRYYQAIREMYNRATEIRRQRATAMEAQADLLEAQELREKAKTKPQILRADAAIMKAEDRLRDALVHTEDTMRQLDEFNKVRLELQSEVRSKYPLGIEQAEEDNWKAVAKYRAMRKSMGHNEQLQHVPLAPTAKTQIGLETGHAEFIAWQAIENPKLVDQLAANHDLQKQIAYRDDT